MRTGAALPTIRPDALLRDALLEMTRKGLGMTTIIDDDNRLAGIFTDGDLRRILDQNLDFRDIPIAQVMTVNCKTVGKNMLAAEALRIIEDNEITSLVALDDDGQPLGVVHLHDLIKAGLA